jgi:hypothetical protein
VSRLTRFHRLARQFPLPAADVKAEQHLLIPFNDD